MQYDFNQVVDRRLTDSFKWDTYEQDALPMWVADMDFPSPEPVIRALRQRIDHGIFGYPMGLMNAPMELPELRGTIVDRMARRYGWSIEPEDIVFIPGVVIAFNLACHTVATPDQAVLVQTPVYTPILTAAQDTGILHQEMELTRQPDGSYTVDWDGFEASLTPQTSLFILCNPHNPVGKVFQPDELRRLAEICLRHGVTICSDEIHSDLIFSGQRHTPIATLDPEIAQNTITLMAPSKTFNLAGLQCSFAIIQNRDLRKRYLQSRKGLVPWVNGLGLLAAQVAYQQGQEWLDQLLPYLESNRDYLYQYVQNYLPGIEMGTPQGTYMAWLDCRKSSLKDNPYQACLDRGRVAFNDGQKFGRGGEGFLRLNFGCPRALLVEGLERLRQVLDQ
ncbi:MAG: aminotransferase class I/II [Chloroflexi bacterium RBG_16_57_11]|nr:MAG: aminotransferase class I/II [Chloroflexi bacterium RBG_16_57_11]